ncbi:MAG: hypothetical protein K6B38_08290 [Ruminococcus sp.]|nr:hypothetical protein [Ruminococcus sp.]
MFTIKIEDQKIETTAKGRSDNILAETILAVIGSARTFSEITHIPVEDAIGLICSSARENCDPEHYEGTVVRMKVPKKGGDEK